MSCVYVLGTVTRRGNFREIDGCMLMKRKYEKKGGKTRSKQKKKEKGGRRRQRSRGRKSGYSFDMSPRQKRVMRFIEGRV